ncbi:MAG: hypothetical protein LBJ44_06675 [Propionibacteriaceae bacterium]|nr:hypothetical protein [Propionibacteriaceae bacterium]
MTRAQFPDRPIDGWSRLTAAVPNFISRILFAETTSACRVDPGDLFQIGCRLKDLAPTTEKFWDGWRTAWRDLAEELLAGIDDGSPPAIQRRILRRAAAANHWGQFLFFSDLAAKRQDRYHIRQLWEESLRSLERPAPVEVVPPDSAGWGHILLHPASRPPWPWTVLFNGLDSSSEVEAVTVAERIVQHGVAVLIPDFPGSGLGLADRPRPADLLSRLEEQAPVWKSDPRLHRWAFGYAGISFGGTIALGLGLRGAGDPAAVLNYSGGAAVPPTVRLPRRLSLEFATVFDVESDALDDRLSEFDLSRQWSNLKVPTLSLVGQFDDIFPAADLLAADAQSDHHRTIVVPSEGHMFLNSLDRHLNLGAAWLASALRSKLPPEGEP